MTRESSVEAKSADNLRRLALARESAIALTLATDGALRLVGRDGEQRMNAAGGAVLFDADGKELATASKQAGQYACSYSAELRGAEVGIPLLGGRAPPGRVLWILDSLSLCQALAKGPIRQDSYAEAHIWRRILEYASQGWHFEIVWVFSHTGLRENDRADEVAEAAVANLPASEPPCWYVDAARHRANDALVRHNDSILALVDAGHPLATPRPVRHIVLPLSDSEILETIKSFLQVRRQRGEPMPKLANFCHVTSKTAWVFPAKAMTALFHRYGVPVCIDGAQAPGHIPLDVVDIGAEFYIGTIHKWMYSCQGVGFLVVSPSKQPLMSPLAPSTHVSDGYYRSFAYSAAYDFSPFLAVQQSFDFVDRLCGGWNNVREYNGQLCRFAVEHLSKEWNLADEGIACIQSDQVREGCRELNCMPVIPFPGGKGATNAEATQVMGYLLTKCDITAFLLVEKFRYSNGQIHPTLAVRLTCQIHVSFDDIRRFGKAVTELKGSYGALSVMKEYLPDSIQSMMSYG